MHTFHIPGSGEGSRLDAWLAEHAPDHSRARWQALIKEGCVRVNGRKKKANHHLHEGDVIEAKVPEPRDVPLEPEPIPLDVLLEDADIICINKPAGLVVHPAPGHDRGTLVNALLHHCGDLQGVGGEKRPGIVHRLDKDTSGVMVIAKHEKALRNLVNQFKRRSTEKSYAAIVRGIPSPETGTVETLIGRSGTDRKKMSANPPAGRKAVTHYAVKEAFKGAALLEVKIETGRTHQIRVHLAHLGHPVLGDHTYGRHALKELDVKVPRQMLHAARLTFKHPVHDEGLTLEAPLPEDMESVLKILRS